MIPRRTTIALFASMTAAWLQTLKQRPLSCISLLLTSNKSLWTLECVLRRVCLVGRVEE